MFLTDILGSQGLDIFSIFCRIRVFTLCSLGIKIETSIVLLIEGEGKKDCVRVCVFACAHTCVCACVYKRDRKHKTVPSS